MSRMIMSVVRMAGGDQESKDCDSCGKTAVKYITIMFFRFDLLTQRVNSFITSRLFSG